MKVLNYCINDYKTLEEVKQCDDLKDFPVIRIGHKVGQNYFGFYIMEINDKTYGNYFELRQRVID